MRAAVLHEVGAPLRPEHFSLEGPRVGEVQVRNEEVGVCHSDRHYMTRRLRCPLPVVVGPEGAGLVEAVGAGVESVRAGDTAVPVGRAVVLPGR
jgi:Zn-dependent alcohol dehydrogenase